MNTKTYYEILEISKGASKDEISSAYETLTENCTSEESLRLLAEARDVLLDDEKRAEYDLNLSPSADEAADETETEDEAETEGEDEAAPVEADEAEAAAGKKTANNILTVILSVLLVLSLAVIGRSLFRRASQGTGDETTAPTTESAPETAFVPDPDPNLDSVSVKSENFSLNNAEMTYLFRNSYQQIVYQLSQSGMSPATVGIDTNASLKTQQCSVDQNAETWFDFFLNAAKNEAKGLLGICEFAINAGFELSAEDEALADSTIAEIKAYAEQNKYTLEEYVKLMYGESVSVDTVRRMLTLSSLSSRYLENELSKVDVSQPALEKIYEEYKQNYETVDYVAYSFNYKDLLPENPTDDDVSAAKSKANVFASELSKCRDKESFLDYARKNMIDVLGFTDSEADKAVSQLSSEKVKYSETSEVAKWAFGAEIGDIHTEESPGGESAITLYLLTGKNGRDDKVTLHNARHILFLSTTYDDDSKAREVYDQWVKDGADVDEFIKLVSKYSEDTGSVSAGGLYEGIYEGQMVDEFNDWVFDPMRKYGDHGIVKTSYGWHIMFYEEGFAEWEYDMKQNLINEAYADLSADIENETIITYDDTLLSTISA